MDEIRIVDVTDERTFGLIPPCADPTFDHRTCDYWEDADRGSKAARPNWLQPAPRPTDAPRSPSSRTAPADNPFAPSERGPSFNPFAPPAERGATFVDLFEEPGEEVENPFAPSRKPKPTVSTEAPRKLQLLGRGLSVFGTYAKVLLLDGEPAAYTQFGPLSAYPRALRLRELYPQLPESPLPAVITCIATTMEARRRGYARRLIEAVCQDLANRGFAAVEAYPEVGAPENGTSAASPAFWQEVGFEKVVQDERFPVYRRELD
jgi:GNAT superfamily N-acetyltransferase